MNDIRPDSYVRCEDFALALDIMERMSDYTTDEMVIALIGQYELTYNDFVFLDEQPGRLHINGKSYTDKDSHWYRRLRQCRNGRNELFDVLKG